ncbi:MAG TPA: bifunctional pyr operon transcriptional regulator/uracil phosphoribosyltransferase PyrR [Nitrospirae bacterium]|nr:bifunctional protein PyrR [bacterium BMS3Abin06]HDH10715.1 bifunctional pyr operon transcriptional regulator/uracil phosphoribosyltransferase PyrR [Nitrospirota bacterium]HDL20884.1 bifunctional pyr operon transcriptional regulator/uracil phosphoribosyltransferase PyrR [Nitrospirota bacterium]HDZ03003.1 bifunctional pyr operon transcriptional regulator/uracil phosphoribosyltransferase PyrR [Nitrospirota bacterium]
MSKEILDSDDINRAIRRIAHEIIEKNRGMQNLCLVGIQKGGVILAGRLASQIQSIEGGTIDVGALDITFYRDDIHTKAEQPVVKRTEIPFTIDNKTVVLVDDVLFTGRSIRAAMDALVDFGRPAHIQLAVLIDRGHRELPIRADYAGKNIPTSFNDLVEVTLGEDSRKDKAVLISGQ